MKMNHPEEKYPEQVWASDFSDRFLLHAPIKFFVYNEEQKMKAGIKRKLILGFCGMAILIVASP